MEFEFRPLRTPVELQACVALQEEAWGVGFREVVPASLLKAVQRVGGVAVGAFDADDRLAGFVFGVTGVEDGVLVHWSDMLAVRGEYRDRGLGTSLKRVQRDRLLAIGVRIVYWSFDPLESKNAYLNFGRLGIVAREYCRDMYGDSTSVLHQGIGTDRLIASWQIDSPRVHRRLAGEETAPRAADVAALPLCNPTRPGVEGPESEAPDLDLDAPRLRIAVPAEIQAMKDRAPALAGDWRTKTRAAFEAYFARGYEAVELVREGERSCYVMERPGRTSLTR